MRYKQWVKYGFPVLLLLVSLTSYSIDNHAINRRITKPTPPSEKDNLLSTLKQAAISMRDYARKNGMDPEVFFLVDMRIPSGKNRFFVYDLEMDSILMAGLVTHGKGNSLFQLVPKFSNQQGSNCTSIGRYKVGNAYTGKFGLAYKLYGLDSTNNNAYKRAVVLHAHESIPDKEVYPYPIGQSEGCPTVSPKFLEQLSNLMSNRNKPVMMYIFS
ncbi:murein L,D-transpeptidase catalytic domain-containing protein [Flavihumibacter fluvii]|uniref:murein L,D-transpeptidase catalytic domain-containing protein n=1 Tax=Flavihumibacter fluvii TaxID=2838157 RepID=UPI001BDEFA21|nr:murein L,D-transpeptidase catalytic domain family protein [Flavihumibacter fluvii]ULQ51138.1 murein L,D-transpeptidase catalytic domain family protein [Flavihumibacter fluvii]